MTNLEKYKDMILNYSRNSFCNNIIEPIILKQLGKECGAISCAQCRLLQQIWLQEEYKEPEPDWSMVAVDTPILVRDHNCEWWIERHFAKYSGGRVFVWADGTTSFTAKGNVIWYKYAKLAEAEE